MSLLFSSFLGIHYIYFSLGEYTINERSDLMYYGYGYPGYGYGYGYGGGWVWAILIVLLILFLVFWTPGANQRPNHHCCCNNN